MESGGRVPLVAVSLGRRYSGCAERFRAPGSRLFLSETGLDQIVEFRDDLVGIGALGNDVSFDPLPAASIMSPMMLLPLTRSPSFSTQTSAR